MGWLPGLEEAAREDRGGEYGGRTLSRYDVSLSRDTGKLGAVTNPRLFATGYPSPQLRLFELHACWARRGG